MSKRAENGSPNPVGIFVTIIALIAIIATAVIIALIVASWLPIS